jgi:hypothetical protein
MENLDPVTENIEGPDVVPNDTKDFEDDFINFPAVSGFVLISFQYFCNSNGAVFLMIIFIKNPLVWGFKVIQIYLLNLWYWISINRWPLPNLSRAS